jgi:hypothetical protein
MNRACNWLLRGAKWNLKRGNFRVALLLIGQMTDFVEDSS